MHNSLAGALPRHPRRYGPYFANRYRSTCWDFRSGRTYRYSPPRITWFGEGRLPGRPESRGFEIPNCTAHERTHCGFVVPMHNGSVLPANCGSFDTSTAEAYFRYPIRDQKASDFSSLTGSRTQKRRKTGAPSNCQTLEESHRPRIQPVLQQPCLSNKTKTTALMPKSQRPLAIGRMTPNETNGIDSFDMLTVSWACRILRRKQEGHG